MRNIFDTIKENNLNLIEVSILVQLDKNYPQAVEIEEANNNELVRENIHNLMQKGFVEQRFQKYRIRK